MSSVNPLVSVVIPSWNGRHHLETCLPALFRQTYTPFEVIVVDNGSQDGTLTWLSTKWPHVRLVALRHNYGVARAFNEGLKAARGALVALLNNDTEPEPGWLAALVAALQRHSGAGMVACKIRVWDDRVRLHAAGDFYTLSGRPGNRGVWEVDRGQYDQEEDVFGPCGAAALYRRELFDDIGLFDERFGSYLEDVDVAWRAQRAGWRCVYTPQAIVYHKVSATGGGPLASFYTGRNWLYVLAKDYPYALWRRHWRTIVREQWRVTTDALRAWRGEAARARLKGQLAGFLGMPRMAWAHRHVSAQTRVDADTLERLLRA
ncbi:MAG: glycosyltransferase family 2 protein [Ardenticatenia bacterium]|nr:glycosyltransferase family 2 protein [Ardenticatenia bacterium]